MQIIKKHIEKLDAHVQKHAPKLHEHAKKVHAHLSKPAKHHHYWLALCGIILRSSIVTYTNSSFARQSLQNIIEFEAVDSIDIATNTTPPFGDTLYIYKETKHIFRNQANAQEIANYPSCVCDQSAMDTSSPHDCEFTNQTIDNGNVGATIGWTPTNAHYFSSNNVGDYCTDNHNAADGGIDIYQRYIAPNQGTGGNNNGYGYGYGYGYTNGYGYGYGYGYRYAKGKHANSPIFYLTKPYIMISQSVWEKYQNINLLPTKMKKIAAGTIEKLFDKKALIEMANELQTSFDRTKQKLETMKTAARSKVQSDYQKARKLFEDGYTALFKKKGLRNKETEQAIKKTSKSENTLTAQVLPSKTIKSKTDTTKQPATANASQPVQDQAIKAPATTKKDGLLKRIKDKMRQMIKDKIRQVKSN